MPIPADLAAALARRYAGRPDTLAEVRANVEAYEKLKAMAYAPSMYAT